MTSTLDGDVSNVSVNGSAGTIAASAGIAQDVLGLQVELQNTGSQTLTLAVGGGVLSDAGSTASTLVITASSLTALNQELAGLVYTANIATTADTLTLSNPTGLDALISILIEPVGTIAGFSQLPTGGQTALFAGPETLVTQPAAPGAIIVTSNAEFDGLLAVNGINGSALLIDAGGTAVFDAATEVTLGSNVTVGDSGSGTLDIETPDFQIGNANLVIAGGTAAAGSLAKVTGGLTIAGNLVVGSQAGAQLDLSGVLSAVATTIGAAGTLTASENADASFGGLVDAGTLLLAGSAQAIATNLDLTGTLQLGSTSRLSGLSSAVIGSSGQLVIGADADFSAGLLVFAGAGAELIIDDLAGYSAPVSGMVGHDVIDLGGIAPSLVSYANNVVSADGSSFALYPASLQPAVEIIADGSGGALITLGGETACFVAGTRLLTPNGYVPVEAFKPGDPIITRSGAKKPVRWTGRRVANLGLKPRTADLPVLVMPGAFGPNIPREKIRLSPSHAIFLDGVLVPVMHLVNGATILRERRIGQVTYVHIELDRHEVLMAEGLQVESYLDTGNRGQFEDESGVRGVATQPYAPLAVCGPALARIRHHLHKLTLRAGFTLIREPDLRGVTGDLKILPDLTEPGIARFKLLEGSGRLMLLAKSAAPADTDPDSDDRRELGICLKPNRLRLGAGWYGKAAGDAGVWMGGSGEVFVPPNTAELTLRLAAVAQSWRHPD